MPFSGKFPPTSLPFFQSKLRSFYPEVFSLYLLGKNAAGYVALAEKDFGYRKSKYVEIENIGVDPIYRSQGIGTKLINAAIEWAKTKGATKLWVSVYWKNKKAINFYKKNHFYETGVELDKDID